MDIWFKIMILTHFALDKPANSLYFDLICENEKTITLILNT